MKFVFVNASLIAKDCIDTITASDKIHRILRTSVASVNGRKHTCWRTKQVLFNQNSFSDTDIAFGNDVSTVFLVVLNFQHICHSRIIFVIIVIQFWWWLLSLITILQFLQTFCASIFQFGQQMLRIICLDRQIDINQTLVKKLQIKKAIRSIGVCQTHFFRTIFSKAQSPIVHEHRHGDFLLIKAIISNLSHWFGFLIVFLCSGIAFKPVRRDWCHFGEGTASGNAFVDCFNVFENIEI